MQLRLDILRYFRKAIFPITGVLIISSSLLLFITEFLEDNIIDISLFVLFSTILIITIAYFVVMNSNERKYVMNQIKVKLYRQ